MLHLKVFFLFVVQNRGGSPGAEGVESKLEVAECRGWAGPLAMLLDHVLDAG